MHPIKLVSGCVDYNSIKSDVKKIKPLSQRVTLRWPTSSKLDSDWLSVGTTLHPDQPTNLRDNNIAYNVPMHCVQIILRRDNSAKQDKTPH